LQILVDTTHAMIYIKNYKYCHFRPNISSYYLFLSTSIEVGLSNSQIHDINTCHNHNLHLPSTNLSLVQKGVLFSGSKIYNHLTLNIKMLSKDAKRFKFTLRTYLTEYEFYSLDKYYQLTS
jgi:hypothetical protein